MSGEIEAAGAAVTAGLIAGAIEGRDNTHEVGGACVNCGAALQGPYCHACGQTAHVHRSLSHMVEEALHGILHFDTKTWRTLPKLAFRPGTLTREYIEGKRARYVSPLALFLFTVFVMFATMAIVGGFSLVNVAQVEVNGTQVETSTDRAAALADLRTQRAEAAAEGDTAGVAALDSVITLVEAGAPASEGGGATRFGDALADAVRSGDVQIETGNAKLDEKIRHKLENPDLLFYKIEQAAYKFAFLLIPISLPLISLLFLWKRGLTLFDHVVFSLYSLSFMSLFVMVMALLAPLTHQFAPADVARKLVLIAVPPVHLFFHLGGTYQLKLFSAIWRTMVLLVLCGLALVIFLTLIFAVGLLG